MGKEGCKRIIFFPPPRRANQQQRIVSLTRQEKEKETKPFRERGENTAAAIYENPGSRKKSIIIALVTPCPDKRGWGASS